jgi:alkanesulfonate monooxygenase SsuD/methylene tetrahydromethanopterin reductase-like flavin-dependent oxidoreductase (luciferase family)
VWYLQYFAPITSNRNSAKRKMLMKYGVVMRTDIDLRTLPDLGRDTEEAGWDGFFIWDGFLGPNPWVLLAAVAMSTHRVHLGTMLTPPSRRRPWNLASEAVTLDRVSNGRVILPVGLGAADDLGFARVGEETDRKVRAELLDESIDILHGLWRGTPFSYEGKHYHIHDATLSLTPVQSPHIPIWVVAAWPRMKSMRRTLRCDGVIPTKMTSEGTLVEMTPEDIRAMTVFVDEHRTRTTPFDIVVEGETPGDNREKATAIVRPFAEAGATWWLESVAATPYKQGSVSHSILDTCDHLVMADKRAK